MTKHLQYSTLGNGAREREDLYASSMALEVTIMHTWKKGCIFWVNTGLYQGTQFSKWSAGCVLAPTCSLG